MNKMFKSNFIFYIKTLVVYGVLIALLHCPSMQYEQKYDEHSVDSVAENLDGVVTQIGVEADSSNVPAKLVYPYARMMNLIEQCRSIESEFRIDTVGFEHHEEEKVGLIKALFDRSARVAQKLKEEKVRFSDYLAAGSRRNQDDEGVHYKCAKGQCGYSVDHKDLFYSDRAALSHRTRRKKATQYTTQVLNEYINRMEFVSDRLMVLIDRVRRGDEAAKVRSESKAKEISAEDN